MKIKQLVSLLFFLFTNSVFAQWSYLSSGTAKNLNEIFFPAADTGFVAGDSGTVLKTINGGLNWISLTTGLTANVNDLYFINTHEGWIVADEGNVCNTLDGGINWNCQQLDSAADKKLSAVFAMNSNDVWVGGSNNISEGLISKTTDGGTTWQDAYIETYVWDILIRRIVMTNANTGFACTRGYVLKTTDGGLNWYITDTASVHAGIMFNVLEDLAFFPNSDTGYVCGWYGPYLGKTFDNAATWQHNLFYQLYSMDFLNKETGYLGGWCNVVKTSDGGNTFIDASGGGSNLFCDIYSIDFTDEWTGYACGSYGSILKTTNGGTTSLDNSIQQENSFSVFPNPVENILNVKSKKLSDKCEFVLYDVTGRIQKQALFSNSLKADLEHLSGGIYLYRIYSDDVLVQTGKIIAD